MRGSGLWLFLCLGVLCTATQAADNVRARFDIALAHENLPAAREIVEAELASDPAHPDWRLARADVMRRAGNLEAALAEVREILVDHPKHRASRLREGQLLSQLARVQSAAEVYARCLAEFPGDSDAFTGLGLTALWQGNPEKALRHFQDARETAPEDEPAFYGQLRAYIATGHAARAWDVAHDRDVREQGRDPELGLFLAGVAARVDALDVALELAARASEDLDLKRRQQAFRAGVLLRQGDTPGALALVEALARTEPPDYDALMSAADLAAAADRRDLAAKLSSQAAALTPGRPEARISLARLASREGRLAGSLAQYQSLVAANPESLDGWLGVLHTAQLMEDLDTARQALERAWAIAPDSAVLFREQILVNLLAGDLEGFDRTLAAYRKSQPADLEAQLWAFRRRAAGGQPTASTSVAVPGDAFSPELAAAALGTWLRHDGTVSNLQSQLRAPADPALAAGFQRATARALALELQPSAAANLVAPHPADTVERIQVLASGWWAYATTPLGHATMLRNDFDPDAVTVWLANETQRRIRTCYVETENRLWEEWLLERAVWLARWRSDPASEPSLRDLRHRLEGLAEGWRDGPGLDAVERAWRRSEVRAADAPDTYAARIDRARWRLYRQDHAGALEALEQLERDYPGATEPVQRQAEVLRASGRLQEAARRLLRRTRLGEVSPADRLELADLLRRTGLRDEAGFLLLALRDEGFEEPELHLQLAALAEVQGHQDAAAEAYEAGLRRHPRSLALTAAYAQWLVQAHRPERLARLLESAPASAVTPDLVAAALNHLRPDRVAAARAAGNWWLSWQWLGWERLPDHAASVLQARAAELAASGRAAEAFATFQPVMDARLPDSELWLFGARLADAAGRGDESDRAFSHAAHLGCGRLDADALRLAREGRRRPLPIARELARRVEAHPDERPTRIAFVEALLRAREVAAARRALAPLIEEDPADPEIRALAALVRAASGEVRQARSLHESVLRQDPLAADSRAALRTLTEADEAGATVGYEYQLRSGTGGLDGYDGDWQEFFASGFWRRPYTQTFSVEYHGFERQEDLDQQLWLEWSRGLGADWVIRVHGGPGIDADYTSLWRAGVGASYTLLRDLSLDVDATCLQFDGIRVWQLIPGTTWRWHPRGTLQGRVYLARNELDSALGRKSNQSITAVVDASWQVGRQSLVVLTGAWGDENNANPTADLIGNDSLQSYGIAARLGWHHRWVLTPSYRLELHQRFDLHALGLSLSYSY